jgi:hypothetical protein
MTSIERNGAAAVPAHTAGTLRAAMWAFLMSLLRHRLYEASDDAVYDNTRELLSPGSPQVTCRCRSRTSVVMVNVTFVGRGWVTWPRPSHRVDAMTAASRPQSCAGPRARSIPPRSARSSSKSPTNTNARQSRAASPPHRRRASHPEKDEPEPPIELGRNRCGKPQFCPGSRQATVLARGCLQTPRGKGSHDRKVGRVA